MIRTAAIALAIALAPPASAQPNDQAAVILETLEWLSTEATCNQALERMSQANAADADQRSQISAAIILAILYGRADALGIQAGTAAQQMLLRCATNPTAQFLLIPQ